jgi:hypothetical protein
MSLLALSLPLYLLGLPVLAGLLYLLHRLRIRHRRLEVVTTLFWQEAIEEARARVFVQRFRHPLVYAFLLLIALLLWTGFADPQLASKAQERNLILVEGSSLHMDKQGSAQARLAVQDLLRVMPADGRSVIWCGKRERVLLLAGEHPALLEARWTDTGPEACPSRLAEIVARLAEQQRLSASDSTVSDSSVSDSSVSERRMPLRLILVGATSLPKQLLEHLPLDMRVENLPLASDPLATAPLTSAAEPIRRSDRPELLSLGLAPAESGDWNRVDVLLRLRAASGSASPELRLELGGKSLAVRPLHTREEDADRFLLTSLPANGELLQVFVAGQAEALGTLALPQRPVLQVQIDEGLPSELSAVVDADPGLSRVSQGKAKEEAKGEGRGVDVRLSTEPGEGGTPRLWFNPRSSAAVFRFTQSFTQAGGGQGEELLRRRFS